MAPLKNSVPRRFQIPSDIELKINEALQSYGSSLQDAGRLAEAVLRLSDFFIDRPEAATPWKETWAQLGYLSYFFPLNLLRNQAVVDEGERVGFFKGLSSSLDFGSGPGTASLALRKVLKNNLLIEAAPTPARWSKDLFGFTRVQSHWTPLSDTSGTVGVFSYSLTELSSLPPWAFDLPALMIIEPSTQVDGRALQNLRQELMARGYKAWAPCTHQESCPLLVHSKKDWCHDRIFFDAPKWFENIEQRLPMKNKTLTFSYLLMRKDSPIPRPEVGRLVGDQLKEKGKTRQMFCRSERREFLAWMDRKGEAPELYRGDLFELPAEALAVSNELRL